MGLSGAYARPTDHKVTLAGLPAANAIARGHFIAPPGYYYLFVVTTPRGSPPVRVWSVAKFVKVRP